MDNLKTDPELLDIESALLKMNKSLLTPENSFPVRSIIYDIED